MSRGAVLKANTGAPLREGTPVRRAAALTRAALALAQETAHRRSVFINCPFGGAYSQWLDAIIFTIICCGFEPRSALETDNVADSRMKRIIDALSGSHLSIHDLSLVYGETGSGIAHLNMPLELGLAVAMKEAHEKGEAKRAHDWTALVLDGSAYVRAISDLNGYDLKRYSTRATLVAQVMSWLVTRMRGMRVPFTPTEVIAALTDYDTELTALRTDWQGLPPWSHIVDRGRAVADRHSLQALSLAP